MEQEMQMRFDISTDLRHRANRLMEIGGFEGSWDRREDLRVKVAHMPTVVSTHCLLWLGWWLRKHAFRRGRGFEDMEDDDGTY